MQKQAKPGRLILVLATFASFAPLAITLMGLVSGKLNANPLQDATFRTGNTAITLLLISMACSPANAIFGWRPAITLRKWIGLYAFAYGVIHFALFTFDNGYIDRAIDLAAIRDAITEKPYALVGLVVLLILIPLAITSTKGWQRRLGKRWKTLHNTVYAACVLAVFHWIWLVKGDLREPTIYAAILAALLLVRIPAVKRALISTRQRLMRHS